MGDRLLSCVKEKKYRYLENKKKDQGWNAYILLINIGARSGDALQALPNDGHDLLFRIGKQDVGL